MNKQAKQGNNPASGKGPRLEDRFGEAGKAISGAAKHVGDGVKTAARAFKGVSGGDVIDLASRAADSGVKMVKPVIKRAGDAVEGFLQEVERQMPPKTAVVQLNEYCQKNHFSQPTCQVTRDLSEVPDVMFVVTFVTQDRGHATRTSKKCKNAVKAVAKEQAAKNLLEKLEGSK